MEKDFIQVALAMMALPGTQRFFAEVKSIAGYELSNDDRRPFLYFHRYVTEPQPRFIDEWRSDTRLEVWYHRLVNGVLGDVQNTFACVLYHRDRLTSIEASVLEAADRFDYRQALGDSALGLGGTLVWDFEYQAFVLALRRCLDYLARAICTYFRNDFHSFRRLGAFLQKSAPADLSLTLFPLQEKYKAKFDFVLSEGDRKSIRDKISHYEYVPAGSLNLNKYGLVLMGGGEGLGPTHPEGFTILSMALEEHVANLRSCLAEMITAFVDAMRAHQANDRKEIR